MTQIADNKASLSGSTYSTPSSRFVDPSLGFDYKAAGLPHFYEVNWVIGAENIMSTDPTAQGGESAQMLQSLLQMVAVYIASLHSADRGNVRYHYYRKKEDPGYIKIDVNTEFIAVVFDINLLGQETVFEELMRLRIMQYRLNAQKSNSFSFAPIVFFGADGNKIYYLESIYGVPSANAYFNARALEFLATYVKFRLEKHTAKADEIPGLLTFEPMMEKQIEECPPDSGTQ